MSQKCQSQFQLSLPEFAQSILMGQWTVCANEEVGYVVFILGSSMWGNFVLYKK